MREIIVSEFVSIDGVMEAPGGEPDYKHTGWVQPLFTEGVGRYKLAEILEAGSLLLGRVTYESFAGAWPQRDDPEGFARKMNTMRKDVVTGTLKKLDWNNSEIIDGRGDVPARIAALKDGDGGPILVHGSRLLVHTLYRHSLVDEYRLMVFPLVLGSGRRVFPDDADNATPVSLVEVRELGSSVAVHVYRPAT